MATAALLALLALAAVVVLPAITEVGAPRDGARGYASGAITEVEIAGAVSVYVDEETRYMFGPDLLAGVILVVLASVSAMTAIVVRLTGGQTRVQAFHALAALGFAALAADELLALHETIGHNVPELADLPGVERPDDAVFAAYLLPAGLFTFAFRDVLRTSRTAMLAFAAALGLFALSAALDVIGSPLDNPVEMLVAVALVVGFAALVSDHLGGALRPSTGPGRATARSGDTVPA